MASNLLKLSEKIHSAIIKILRDLRKEDESSRMSPARLSVLSVLVFLGEKTLKELAQIEQVKPPTMTNLVQGLEKDGYVRRLKSKTDKREQKILVTTKGKQFLLKARQVRLKRLSHYLSKTTDVEREILAQASEILLSFRTR
jgi:DNA-binding MarR family transcriptional regulator